MDYRSKIAEADIMSKVLKEHENEEFSHEKITFIKRYHKMVSYIWAADFFMVLSKKFNYFVKIFYKFKIIMVQVYDKQASKL